MAVHERTWRIGEVATATGLTVRALHHYDQIGLVVPSGRTSGRHRLYASADLAVLYQVTALRQLGLPLDQVAAVLAGDTDMGQVIDRQLEHVDRQIRMARRLREQLLAARQGGGDAGFAEIIKLTGDLAAYLSPGQIDALGRRMGALGVAGEHAVGVEMPRLYGEAMAEMRSGTPPADPAVRRIVDRLDELAALIRGPDAAGGAGAAVRTMWVDRGAQQRRAPEAPTGAPSFPTWTGPAPRRNPPVRPPGSRDLRCVCAAC